jgi:hypothetical protein
MWRPHLRDTFKFELLPASIVRTPVRPAIGECDRGVTKLNRGVVDLRLIVVDRRDVLRNQRDLRVALLRRDRFLRGQPLVALQIEPGIGEQRFVARLGSEDLVKLCLIGTGVDLGEQIAGLHVLTLDEDDFVQGSVDANPDGHGVIGLNRAEPGEINRRVAHLRCRDDHRYRRNSQRGRGFEQFPQEQSQAYRGQADQGTP